MDCGVELMGRLRITYSVEYEVNPADYLCDTMEEAAAEEREALESDLIGVLATVEGDEKLTVEVV